jgi:hypothetical protein
LSSAATFGFFTIQSIGERVIEDWVPVFVLEFIGKISVRLVDASFRFPRICEAGDVEKGITFVCKAFVVPADHDSIRGGNDRCAIASAKRRDNATEGVSDGDRPAEGYEWDEKSAGWSALPAAGF